ncbi:MAG: hypothetical protein ABIR15_21425 [Chitinophagaceae bacterium]
MKTFFTLLMPLLIAITFIISSKFFSQADYLLSALFTLTAYSATSLWITIISSKKLVLR